MPLRLHDPADSGKHTRPVLLPQSAKGGDYVLVPRWAAWLFAAAMAVCAISTVFVNTAAWAQALAR